MKKVLPIIFIAASLLTLTLVGCSNADIFKAKSYTSDDGIKSVFIDVSDRMIDIVASGDNNIHIEYYDGEKEYLDITESEDKELSVKLTFNKNWTDFIGKKAAAEYRKITVKLPENLISLTVKTTNEAIKIKRFAYAATVKINNIGGNIEFEKISVGSSLELTAKNGNILGSVLGDSDEFNIKCTVKKGDTNLPAEKNGGAKSLNVNCNNGDIIITFEEH